MRHPLRVNLHCHSDLSDGSLPPERVAEALAGAKVVCAALTDHDTTAGLERFEQVLKPHGIALLPGVEITVAGTDGQMHVLAYGFDPQNPELQELLKANRQRRAGTLADPVAPPYGGIEAVLRSVHKAGGTVFLAHPLDYISDVAQLEQALGVLRHLGLDGIEALYRKYTPEQQAKLVELADQHHLLICAGTDFHGFDQPGLNGLALDFPPHYWAQFRAAHAQWGLPTTSASDPAGDRSTRRRLINTAPHFPWKRFVLRTVFPTLLAIALFVFTIFFVMLPFLESTLLQRNRKTIRELTNSAWSILAEGQQDVATGRLTLDAAQELARTRIEALRYGDQRKDYFWITDLQPRMIMHPYRKELNGADLTDFSDIRGRKLFVESVRLVRGEHEGFVQYYWQWQDNPDRVVPKESFVRLFEPWGWIIGTGMYLDDVKTEVDQLTHRLVQFCLAITALVTLLLAYTARENLRIERQRTRAEAELRESHEKYATLVEAATEGTLMVLEGKPAYANRTMAELLGYSAAELTQLNLFDLFPSEPEAPNPARAHIQALAEGGPEPEPFAAPLRTRAGNTIKALLNVTRIALAGKVGFILVARDISQQKSPADRHEALLEELQTSLLALHRPLKDVPAALVTCDLQMPIARAAALMTRSGASALAVTSGGDGAVVGIVTDQDLRQRVLAAGRDAYHPVMEIMTAPVIALADTTPLHEALLAMRHHQIQHLAVRNAEGRIVGLVRATDLMAYQQHSPAALTAQVELAGTWEELSAIRRQVPQWARMLLDSGANPLTVARLNTRLSDAITQRLIALAQAELGPAPAEFCFLALGSQGRAEQTLFTDQDHALVYQDAPAEQAEAVAAYFLALGQRVSAGLEHAGYLRCRGEVMASNPRWCQPVSVWQRYFTKWITGSTPQDLLECNTFFDFRPAAGNEELAHELRRTCAALMQDCPEFFIHFAQNALLYKPPIGFFGQLVTDASGPEGHTLNLKEAMMPIVNFARLYALRHNDPQTHTVDRLDRLVQLQVLKTAFHEELVQAYTFLMQLRLTHQAAALAAGATPDNTLNPKHLTPLREAMLKHSFALITTLQKKISYDFLGGIV